MNYGATWKGKKEPVDPCQFLDKFAEGSRVTIGGPPRQLNPTYVQCRKQQGIRVYYERDPLNRFGPSKLVEGPYVSGTTLKEAAAAAQRAGIQRIPEEWGEEPKWTFLEEVLWGEGIPTWVWVAVGAAATLFLTRRRK
jgi:hypothetical protein